MSELSPSLSNDSKKPSDHIPQLGGQAALAHLTDAMRDNDPAVCQRAFDALEEHGGEEVLEGFIRIIREGDNRQLRKRAIQTVDNIGSPQAVPVLAEVITTDIRSYRIAAARALRRIGEAHPEAVRPVAETIIEQVESKTWTWHISAINILGEIGHPVAIPIIYEQLSDEDSRRAIEAAASLTMMRDLSPEIQAQVDHLLLTALADTEHGYIQMLARSNLYSGLAPRLFEIAENEGNAIKVRQRAILYIGVGCNPANSERLIDLLETCDQPLRKVVENALKKVRNPRSLSRLIALSENHPEPDVRIAAMKILGIRKSRQAIATLRRVLSDADPGVREAAVEALGRIRAHEAYDDLFAMLDDPDEKVQEMIYTAIKQIALHYPHDEPPRVIVALRHQLTDADPDIREVAAQTLGHIRAQQVHGDDLEQNIPALRRRLTDADPKVRRAAVQILGAIWVREAYDDLVTMLYDPHEQVRDAVVNAIKNNVDHFSAGEIDALILRLKSNFNNDSPALNEQWQVLIDFLLEDRQLLDVKAFQNLLEQMDR